MFFEKSAFNLRKHFGGMLSLWKSALPLNVFVGFLIAGVLCFPKLLQYLKPIRGHGTEEG